MTALPGTRPEEPRPAPPPGPPPSRLRPRAWARANLFSTGYNVAFTIVFGTLLLVAIWRAVRFALVTGRWEVIDRNLRLLMVGRFPVDELHRVWIALFVLVVAAGLAAGLVARSRPPEPLRDRLRPLAPVGVLVVALLLLTDTLTPTLLTVVAAVLGLAARAMGRRLPVRAGRWLPWIGLAAVAGVFASLLAFDGVGWDRWGGLLLTLYLAVAGILLSFPLGVLLALGRRSSFPAVRVVCVGYIELIRGVPLITLLFMGVLALGFFLPEAIRPGKVVSVIVALVLFTAAYVAEIVRGGLQGVPRGQVEAAQALGLSPLAVTRKVVLPQALRNVIPALVGQFISLFKDTSLATIVGLLELLDIAQAITQQGDFFGQGLQAEVLVFAGFVYWTFCFSMSRSSQRLERRLGVGLR
jgi:general L-amino acid transport system permease protein